MSKILLSNGDWVYKLPEPNDSVCTTCIYSISEKSSKNYRSIDGSRIGNRSCPPDDCAHSVFVDDRGLIERIKERIT